MTEQCTAITVVQRVPDAAWFERQIAVFSYAPGLDTTRYAMSYQHTHLDYVRALAARLRGNLSVNADAVLVDGPTLRDVLDAALACQAPHNHAYGCGMNASYSNPCTCWRAKAEAMLESLKEVQK